MTCCLAGRKAEIHGDSRETNVRPKLAASPLADQRNSLRTLEGNYHIYAFLLEVQSRESLLSLRSKAYI